ncbi:hypothetical protein NAD41_000912 [Salmonella enterica]|nr:hypothetical protein [Salmonella enterica]EKK6596296.1 hypothetical protein [Salmonella enterica]
MNEMLNNILSIASTATPLELLGDFEDLPDEVMLDQKGVLLPQPASFWAEATNGTRAMFGRKHGIYSFPTHEGIDFIKGCIDGRELQTIEIAAGNGGWGKALGIRATDSFLQRRADVAAKYASMRQPTVAYGAHVEKLEAIKAVRKYRPKIVVASWVTQKFRADRFCMRGNEDGVDELRLFELVDEYILIGNTAQHGDKMIVEDCVNGCSTHEIVGACYEGLASRAQVGRDFIFHFRRKMKGVN